MSNRIKSLSLAALLIASGRLTVGNLGHAEGTGPAVAVRTFSGTIPEMPDLNGLSNILVGELANAYEPECGGSVVEWIRRKDMLKELELQQRPEVAPNTRLELGQLMQPDLFVDGNFSTDGTTYSYTIQVTDVITGELVSEIEGSGPDADLLDFDKQLTTKLVKELCKANVGFKLSGQMDEGTIRGTVCGNLTKPFTATSPEVAGTWQFTPKDSGSGTFSYKANNVGGAQGSGSGTYTVVTSGKGTKTIKLKGSGSVSTPFGSFSAPITESLQLTPIKTCARKGNS